MIRGLVARHSIGVLRPVRVDDGRGGVESDFSGSVEVTLQGWALDAGPTIRDDVNREGVEIVWTARGPLLADVERFDKVLVFGEEFMIDGAVLRQPGPSSLTSHTILALKRWEG